MTGGERNVYRLVLLQRSLRKAIAGGKRALSYALEIGQRCIAPPLGFLFLNGEKRGGFGKSLGIHERSKRGPSGAHLSNVVRAARVVDHEFVPKCMTGGHRKVPGQVVKPEQVLLRRERWVVEYGREGGCVLRDGVAARGTAIKANTLRIGAVVIGRRPIET